MALTLIVFTLLLEIAFTSYCFYTKDNQVRLRAWMRISAFILFISLLLISTLQWSFRWYALAMLLSILAILGLIKLNSKKPTIPFRPLKRIIQSTGIWLMISIALIPALMFPQYKLPAKTGNFIVKTQTFTETNPSQIETFTNTGEFRTVTFECWYPENASTKVPLTLFSHGAFGVRMSNTSTYENLASNGYVVCAIDHSYHAAATIDVEGNFTLGSDAFKNEIIQANQEVYTPEEELAIYKKWFGVRTSDIAFVLDFIKEKAIDQQTDIVFDKIDPNKIGLFGHSLGGAASAQLGRTRQDIDAVINLDGTMLGEYVGLEKDQPILNPTPYPIAILNFYSQDVQDHIDANPEFIYPNKEISKTSENAFEVTIAGSNHMSYTDLPMFSPILSDLLSGVSGSSSKATVDPRECIETTNELILRFFDVYLKEKGTFHPNY